MLDLVIRVNKKYYPQTVLEECKYEIKKNEMENLINDDLDSSSSNESNNESYQKSENESDMNLIMNLRNLRGINLLIMNLKIKTLF